MLALARAVRDAGAPAMTRTGFGHLAPTLRRGATPAPAPFVLEAAHRHVDRLGSAGWHRLVHFALVASSTGKLTGAEEPGRLRFESLEDLCATVGLPSHHTAAARELLELGAALRFDFGGARAPAWAAHVAPGRPNRVDWQIMPWLYDPHADRLGSKLLLFVPATPAPTVGGDRARSTGEHWALFWRWLAWLPGQAGELRDAGTLTLPRATWETLADDAGWSAKLRRDRLDDLREEYIAAGFLGHDEGDRYAPGPALEAVANAVKAQADLRDAGRRGGRKRRKRGQKPQ